MVKKRDSLLRDLFIHKYHLMYFLTSKQNFCFAIRNSIQICARCMNADIVSPQPTPPKKKPIQAQEFFGALNRHFPTPQNSGGPFLWPQRSEEHSPLEYSDYTHICTHIHVCVYKYICIPVRVHPFHTILLSISRFWIEKEKKKKIVWLGRRQ